MDKQVDIKNWNQVYALHDHRTIFNLSFHAIEEVDGYKCLAVYFNEEIRGYLPPSELGIEEPTERDIHRLLKMEVPVLVTGIMRKEGIVILSRRLSIEKMSNKFWTKVEKGQIVEGIVLTPPIPNKPLSIEVEGVQAEVPADELAWDQWIYPRELQKLYPLYGAVKALVIDFNSDEKKLKVSLKAVKPDPWENIIPGKYKINDIHLGIVINANKSGVLIRFYDGVVCRCAGKHNIRPGEKVQVVLRKVDIIKRRMYGALIDSNRRGDIENS